jgi:hypothetical protein
MKISGFIRTPGRSGAPGDVPPDGRIINFWKEL